MLNQHMTRILFLRSSNSCLTAQFLPAAARAILAGLLFCWLPLEVFPQKKLSRKQFLKDSTEIVRQRIIRPQLRVDNRITLHRRQSLTMNGFDAGVLLKEKLRLTLGYYSLNEDLNAYTTVVDGSEVRRFVKLNYGSINTEYFYLNTRFISLGLPLDFGFGGTELRYRNLSSGETYGRQSGFVFLTDFGLSAIFKPIRWIGIKGVGGYRKFIINPVKGFNFDGFFMSIGLNIDLREIIKDVNLYKLKKKYKRGNPLENAVDLITD